MQYDWYKIFNKTEFEALDLTSKKYTVDLQDRGEQEFLVTSGVDLGITHADIFLPLEMNGDNPFEFESMAIYINSAQDVFWGYAVEE